MDTVQAEIRFENIGLRFGGVSALDGVNFEVWSKQILAIIGPNGAGKTCTINSITGYYKPQVGNIYYRGKQIKGWPTHRITRMGIARTFQNIGLYTGLTVLDNLMVARHQFINVMHPINQAETKRVSWLV